MVVPALVAPMTLIHMYFTRTSGDTEITLYMYLLQTSREDNRLLHSRLPWYQNSIM